MLTGRIWQLNFDMRSHVSGMSVREVLQEPSRTADSSDKEWLSDM